jgi:hypothetical protein
MDRNILLEAQMINLAKEAGTLEVIEKDGEIRAKGMFIVKDLINLP